MSNQVVISFEVMPAGLAAEQGGAAVFGRGDDTDVLSFREDNNLSFEAIDHASWCAMSDAVETLQKGLCVVVNFEWV